MEQLQLDWTRGRQLQAIKDAQIPSGRHKSRSVSGATLKWILARLDDVIGKQEHYVIAIERIVKESQRARSTVKTSLAVLHQMGLISVHNRFEVVNGERTQLPSRYAILWDAVEKLRPVVEVIEEPAGPVILIEDKADTLTGVHAEPGGVNKSRGWVQQVQGVGSTGPGGGFNKSGGSVQGEPHSAPVRPVSAHTRTNPAPCRGGTSSIWKTTTADDLRTAVRKSEPALIDSLWTAGVRLGWIPDTQHYRHQFYSTVCYAVSDDAVRDPKGWLVSIVKRKAYGVGLDGGRVNQAEDRARQLIREQDGLTALPREPRESRAAAQPVRDKQDQIAALRALAGSGAR